MKKLIFLGLAAAAVFVFAYAPARERVMDAVPDKVTSMFESDPLPKDLVLGLTDNFDLAYSLPSVEGTPLGSADQNGKIALVLIWNTDCGDKCLDTIHHMQKLARKYREKGVVAVTINNDMLTKGKTDDEVRDYVKQNNIKLPVLLMDLPTGQQFWPNDCKYGLAKQPFHELLVYDRNGSVRFRANQD